MIKASTYFREKAARSKERKVVFIDRVKPPYDIYRGEPVFGYDDLPKVTIGEPE